MEERKITLTLLRPMPTVEYGEHGMFDGPAYPNSTVRVEFPLAPGSVTVDGLEVDVKKAMECAARLPCKHLDTDWCDCGDGYPCSHGSWFWCRRFSGMDPGVISVCRGDMCRCPSSKVRAEARSQGSGGDPKQWLSR